jgi:membrane protein DedA with SNARE-associated domain/membrane-associated phospholipid phosphatase
VQQVSRVVEVLLRFHGPPAYALIFLLPALEASAFTGFLVPGEVAVLLGGVLAFHGSVSLWGIGAAAIGGAIVGDSAGYAVGRRLGEAIFSTRLLRWLVRPDRRRSAEELLRRRGATAVVLGRFTAVLRVLVPGLSGMARMRYRRFFVASAVGGAVWAGAFTLLGYAAGDAWRTVERVAARASLLLGLLIVFLIGAVIAVRRVAANEERIKGWAHHWGERPRVAAFRRRYAGQLGFLFRRLDPHEALGLYLTIGLALSVGAGWAFGAAAQDIVSGEQLLVGDASLARFVAAHRNAGFSRVLVDLTSLGHPPVVVALVLVAALVVARLARSLRPGAFVVVSVSGGELLSLLVGALVGRPAPLGSLIAPAGSSFPSGHTVVAATLLGAVAFAVSVRPASWATRVWVWAAAVVLVCLVGLSAIYLAIAHVSDVLGGATLGAAWLAVSATGWRTWERLNRARGTAGGRTGAGGAPRLQSPT